MKKQGGKLGALIDEKLSKFDEEIRKKTDYFVALQRVKNF